MARALVVMGVSGSGKSTVGHLLALRLGWEFVDADDYHSAESRAKMAAGEPLGDRDREPWLRRLRELLEERLGAGRSLVLACSALKRSYRRVLDPHDPRVDFVYLRGSYPLISRRIEERRGHFMKAELLRSQFADLEEPDDALVVAIDRPPDELAGLVVERLGLDQQAPDA